MCWEFVCLRIGIKAKQAGIAFCAMQKFVCLRIGIKAKRCGGCLGLEVEFVCLRIGIKAKLHTLRQQEPSQVCLPKNWNQGKAYFYEESRESTAYLSRWKMGIELVVRLFWVTML